MLFLHSIELGHSFHTNRGCNVHGLPSLPLEWGDQVSRFAWHRGLILGHRVLGFDVEIPSEPLNTRGNITDWPELPWEVKIPTPLWSELPARVGLNHYKGREERVTVPLAFGAAGALCQLPLSRLIHLPHILVTITTFCMCHDVKRLVCTDLDCTQHNISHASSLTDFQVVIARSWFCLPIPLRTFYVKILFFTLLNW